MSYVDAEEIFPARPGGMVDTARQRAQAEQDQAAASLSGQEVTQSGYQAVRVRQEPANAGTARTITLSSANPVAPLLPRDETRRSAVILAVDNDVWYSYNEGTAADLAGTSGAGSAFYLPAGIAVPILNTAQIWVSPTTFTGSSRVSVSVDRDSTP